MPKHKSILIPHRWTEAGRARKCYHSPDHEISKGDRVLEVKVQMGWQGYCQLCGEEMIRLAADELGAAGQKLTPKP